jgi:hypothetical protein
MPTLFDYAHQVAQIWLSGSHVGDMARSVDPDLTGATPARTQSVEKPRGRDGSAPSKSRIRRVRNLT